jgi:CubicO group peptidase (beta-lactamase class C family)
MLPLRATAKGDTAMKNAQARMQALLDALVREGKERGVQLAAYVDGVLAVDVWAGEADAATGRPVDGQTLFPVFSTSKGITATLVHILVHRGKLTYDTPVASVWPEFAANGKAGITLRHVLSHTAGLPHMPMGIGYTQLGDWDAMCAALARLRPVSPPGANQVYHAVTYGWLAGEVARRVDGRPFQRMLHEEICRPLGITGMFMGIPDEMAPRVAVLEEVFESGKEPSVDDAKPQAVPGWMLPLHGMMNRPDARRACVPASTGIMNARSIARHYAALVPGGVDGVEILPPNRVREATRLQRAADPTPEDWPQRVGLGYCLGDESGSMGPRPTAFGTGGYGGSQGYADPEYRLAVGFTKNLFSKDGATARVLRELRDALGIPQ